MSEELSNVPVPRLQPSASYSFTMRLHMPQHGGAFARIARAIADAEAMLGAIDLVRVESQEVVRDVTVACVDSAHAEAVVRAVRDVDGVRVDSVSDRTFLMHKGGKIEVNSKVSIKTRDDLSMAYTPGVARVSMAIHEDPAKAWALTIKSNNYGIASRAPTTSTQVAIPPTITKILVVTASTTDSGTVRRIRHPALFPV